jgi:hypothetical protein
VFEKGKDTGEVVKTDTPKVKKEKVKKVVKKVTKKKTPKRRK